MATRTQELFDWLRMAQKNYSTEQLRKIVDQWLDRQLQQQVTAYRLSRREGRSPPDPLLADPDQLGTLSAVVSDSLDHVRFGAPRQAKEAYDLWEPLAAQIAESAGIDFNCLAAEERERLTLYAMGAEFRRYWLLSQHSPDFPRDLWEALDAPSPAATPARANPSPALSEAWDLCVKHYQDAGRKSWQIADGTGRAKKNQHAKWLREDLFELWGADKAIWEITWEDLEALRACFQRKYPASRKRKPAYRDRTLKEIASGPDVPEEDRIRGTTKETKFRLARDFFGFLRAHPRTKDHFRHDAVEVLKVAPDPQATYEPWTLPELRQILESSEVHTRFLQAGASHHPAGMFWLLVILAYTGARQQEIMGLRAKDVELGAEFPVFHIREHEYRPSVKTDFSTRWIPVHRDLLELGIADWLRFRSRFKAPTLWPTSDRGSHYWADSFREDITKPLGLHRSRRKVMHSFRSTFDSLASNVMPTEARRLMTGHTDAGSDYRHYLRQLDEFIPSYSEYINRVDLKLNLGVLKKLWKASLRGERPS